MNKKNTLLIALVGVILLSSVFRKQMNTDSIWWWILYLLLIVGGGSFILYRLYRREKISKNFILYLSIYLVIAVSITLYFYMA